MDRSLRLVRFTLAPEHRATTQGMADALIAAITPQPGCLGASFFGGGADGESGLVVLWDSQEHADEAAAVIRPSLDQYLDGKVSAPVEARLFPVLAS